MYSMTGFGKGEYRDGEVELTVELKSVNNRFLDISLRCPHLFASYEDAIRSAVRSEISRGHIDVFVSVTDKREKQKNFTVDYAAARAYADAAKSLWEATGLANDVTVSFLLKTGDVLLRNDAQEADETLGKALECALKDALAALKAMRLKEGERLKQDLLARMDTIAQLRERIALRAPCVTEEYRKRLTARIEEYLGGKADESRILTEAAIFADKCNIDEELTRLKSHIEEFRRIAQCDTVGRKLDFLLQEFNRECNTICSKSCDAVLTASALDMKNEIEKVREQIQNLE